MKFLPSDQSLAWWARRPQLAIPPAFAPLGSLPSRRLDANFEAQQTAAYMFARHIMNWLFVYDGPVLASVFEYGIWPSSENLHLYYTWRRSHGNFELLEDAPGHLFLKHESEDFATLLHLAFLFGWGLSCAEPDGERAFHVDHDGHGLAIGRSGLDEIAPILPPPPQP
jgi:hypothetical protein